LGEGLLVCEEDIKEEKISLISQEVRKAKKSKKEQQIK